MTAFSDFSSSTLRDLRRLTDERDQARDIAVRLEQENAVLRQRVETEWFNGNLAAAARDRLLAPGGRCRMSAPELSGEFAAFDAHGQGLLIPGHGLDSEAVAAASRWAFGDDAGRVVRSAEYHLSEQRRVTWCGRHGDACDMEGEQHTHWHSVRPTDDPSRHYTFVWQERIAATG